MSQLISARALDRQRQQGRVWIIDTRARLDDPEHGRQAYARSHIPGAQFLNLDEELSAPVRPGVTGRHPLPEPELLEARLRQLGLQQGVPVVVYDDGPGFFAARLWWLLRWLGHDRVQLLSGGLQAWLEEGLPLQSKREIPAWPGNFAATVNTGKTINADAIMAQSGKDRLCLLDARSPERFRGDSEPIDPVAGHIPGAYCLPCAGNLDSGGRFLPAGKLRERFPTLPEGGEYVSYCGSGVTACHNILAAVEAGLAEPRLYAGSWSEWITDSSRPVARGQ